jgi:hypothetical protein
MKSDNTKNIQTKQDFLLKQFNALSKSRTAFRSHLIPYVSVNAFLIFLWAITGGGHPWFIYPLLGWGVGLSNHWTAFRNKLRGFADYLALKKFSAEELKLLKKLNKKESNFRSHMTTNISVSFLLLTINVITSPGFPWCAFPIGGLIVGLFSRLPSFNSKIKRFKWILLESFTRRGQRDVFEDWFRYRKLFGVSDRVLDLIDQAEDQIAMLDFFDGDVEVVNEDRDAVRGKYTAEAQKLKTAILKQIRDFKGMSDLPGTDIESELTIYIGQIEELEDKNDGIESILNGIPYTDLEKDRLLLVHKIEKGDEPGIIKEYKRAVEEIEKQQKSFDALKKEKEIIDLRLKGAIGGLNQMRLNIARMDSRAISTDPAALESLRDKVQEITEYIHDIEKGFEELEEF